MTANWNMDLVVFSDFLRLDNLEDNHRSIFCRFDRSFQVLLDMLQHFYLVDPSLPLYFGEFYLYLTQEVFYRPHIY